MLYLAIFFVFASILLVLLYVVNVNIIIRYKLDGLDDHIAVTFSALWGLVHYDLKFKSRLNNKSEAREGEKPELADSVRDKFENFKHVLGLIKRIRIYLQKKIVLRKLTLKLEVGTGDAYFTGILGGMLWGVAGAFTAYITSNFRTKRNVINVKPNFMEKVFKVELYCIFSVKTVHIIVVGLKILSSRRKKAAGRTGEKAVM